MFQVMARSKDDHPAIVFIAFVGNDVCNGHPDTVSHMTTVDEWREKLVAGLQQLDAKLPKGVRLASVPHAAECLTKNKQSKVVIGGTIDGRILWDNLYDQPHPFGETVKVLYEDVYR